MAVRNSKPRVSLKNLLNQKTPLMQPQAMDSNEYLVTAKQSSPRRHLVPVPVYLSACELQQRAGCKSNFDDSHN